jgi:hypothetical protein
MADRGNITNYITSQGCSQQGLSVGCPVGAADGWYSDGVNSYYVESQTVTSVNYDPCYTAPPPPPPPPAETWVAVILAVGTGGSGGSACIRAQDGRTFTYYVNNYDFVTAGMLRTNSDGSGIPNDGNYSDGSIVRASSNGTLGSSTNCDIV